MLLLILAHCNSITFIYYVSYAYANYSYYYYYFQSTRIYANPSLCERGYVFASVCLLLVGLSVCQQEYSKTYEWIFARFSEVAGLGIENNRFDFRGDLVPEPRIFFRLFNVAK